MSTDTTTTTAPALTLADYLKATPSDAPFVGQCNAEAEAIVAEALRSLVTGTERPCPAEVRTRAVVEVGAELFARRGLRNGVATFTAGGDGDLTPIRVPRDPMHLARSILAPYIGGPFA